MNIDGLTVEEFRGFMWRLTIVFVFMVGAFIIIDYVMDTNPQLWDCKTPLMQEITNFCVDKKGESQFKPRWVINCTEWNSWTPDERKYDLLWDVTC